MTNDFRHDAAVIRLPRVFCRLVKSGWSMLAVACLAIGCRTPPAPAVDTERAREGRHQRAGWLLADVEHGGATTRLGAVIRGPTDRRRLALAFTAHEFAEGADTILRDLARRDARASFFLTGVFVESDDGRRMIPQLVADGHYVGPHSDKHLLYCRWEAARTTCVTRAEFATDLADNIRKLQRFMPPSLWPVWFMPPYEHYNAEIAAWAIEEGCVLVNFTPGTRSNADYTGEADRNFVSSQVIFDSILRREREDAHGLNGFILLLHLGAGPGRADKFHFRFGELLDQLRERGYEFVRVDVLLNPDRQP